MSDAAKALSLLGPEHLGFIEKELGVSKDDIEDMSDDEFSELYDQLADIEVEEVCTAGDDDVSERGNTAADIVTILGNELYRPDSEEQEK